MSRHDSSITFRQMCNHIEEAVGLAKGRTCTDLESDRVLYLALLKLVEIVGEAATRIPDTMQMAHPDIPWREMIGTRNRLIHGYDAVDCDILWHIVTVDFPPLVSRIKAIMQSEG